MSIGKDPPDRERLSWTPTSCFRRAPTRLLLGAAQSGLYRARWSERILSEARTSLTAKDRLGEGNIERTLLPRARSGRRAGHGDTSRGSTRSRRRGGRWARYLITGNLAHFDAGETTAHGFEVMHFDAFGEHVALHNLGSPG
ncbi:MAG: hypothetical protein QOJ23_4798 [Actinomycetota bacterium]|nr:hypothetical protein [Actinomycetota bacterium]MDQ1565665.1 hypothetical protein [Actinomycetota bacterium]